MAGVSMTQVVFLCTCVLLVACPVRAVTRYYYVAAVEEEWDYAPGGGDRSVYKPGQESQSSVFLENGPNRIGRKYLKALYREFTDDTFTKQKPREPWQGIVGPIIAGELGDVIVVTFKNMARFPFTMHPHGLAYLKDSEGALYVDGTSGDAKADDAVPPGATYVYTWRVTPAAAPSDDDEECLTWTYHSHMETVRDTNSGLVGILLTCKPGALARVAEQYTQFAVVLQVIDENLSWYLDYNIQTYAGDPASVDKEDEGFKESNLMHGINGLVYGHLEGLEACVGSTVLWHLVGFGTEIDIHSLTISGHSFLTSEHRQAAIMMNPVDFFTAKMTVNEPGQWRVYCNIYDHITSGMVALFNALKCGKTPSKKGGKQLYFIGIDEVMWDYAPGGQNRFDGGNLTDPGSPSETYFQKNDQRVGGVYLKAVYREYKDPFFRKPKERTDNEAHYGILGPVINATVGDTIRVVLKNNARFPFSITTNGAIFMKTSEGALYEDGTRLALRKDDIVKPGQRMMYTWYIPEDMGPGPEDPPCIVRMYTSSSRDIVKDGYSGLFGPMLICREGAYEQMQVDREFFLFFSVIDENQSWYSDINFQNLVGVDREDEGFYESNLMHGINGNLFGTLPGLEMCAGDRVVWYAFSLGTEVDLHSVYLHGQSLTIFDTHRSATALLPGYFKTLFMEAQTVGEWALVCRTNDHFIAGMKALFNIRDCAQSETETSETCEGKGIERTYFLQAEEEMWDYAPSRQNMIGGGSLLDPDFEGYIFTRNDPPFLGTKYMKVRYHQYTDATFATPVTRAPEREHLGILGPLISAAVCDTVTVVFRNAASRPYSVHAQGLAYNKSSEGAPYAGGGGAVPPGGVQTYTWTVPPEYAPAQGDPPCITQAYYSAVDPVRDTYSGLIGPVRVCREGILDSQGNRLDIDYSFFVLWEVFDENLSWYMNAQAPAGLEGDFRESNLMHAINGFIYGNNPPMVMPQNSPVDWHLMTLGTEIDIHSVHFHGNDIEVYETGIHHRDVTQLFPGVFTTVRMKATEPAQWLMHCHVHDHLLAGMETTYTVTAA